MSAKIKFLKDKVGNTIYPVTKISGIYDDSGIGLDDKLNTYYRLQGGIAIQEGEDLNDPKFLEVGNYYCESNDLANTLVNLPQNMEKRAFTMHVYSGTGNGYPVQHIETYDWGRMYRRMFEPYNRTYTWWVKYLDVNDMASSDTINDSGKVPSSAVTYQLGQEIDSLNQSKLSISNTPTDPDTAPVGISYFNGTTNAPLFFEGDKSGFVICVEWNIDYRIQFAMSFYGDMIAYRRKINGTWQPWVEK